MLCSVCCFTPLMVLLVLSPCIFSSQGSVIHIPDSDGRALNYYLCNKTSSEASTSTKYVLQSNVTHILDPSPNGTICIVKDTNDIVIQSSDSSPATVKCSNGSGLGFTNVNNLQILNVNFNGCGGRLSKESVSLLNQRPSLVNRTIQIPYPDFNAEQTYVGLMFINCFNLHIHGVVVSGYYGFGMIIRNISDNITLSSVTVTNAVRGVNGTGLTIIHIANETSAGSTGSVKPIRSILNNVTITYGWTANFGDDLVKEIDDKYRNPVIRVPAGISVIVIEPIIDPPNPVDIAINDLTVYNNVGGGMLVVFVNRAYSSISINGAYISSCLKVQHMVPQPNLPSSQKHIGEALTVYYVVTDYRPIQEQFYKSITLQNIDFVSSKSDSCRGDVPSFNISRTYALSTVFMRVIGSYVGRLSGMNQIQSVNISNVAFVKDFPGISYADFGMGLFVYSFLTIDMTLHNVTSSDFSCTDSIEKNASIYDSDYYNSDYSCVNVASLAFNRMKQLNVVNGVFSNHTDCSVFYAQEANTHFTGNITIENNQGVIYGAMQLVRFSRLFFQEPLTLVMRNNSALYGAALYVYEEFSVNCALQFIPQPGKNYSFENYTTMDITLTYSINRALLAGNTIYANLLHYCGHSEFDYISPDVNGYPTLFTILLHQLNPSIDRDNATGMAEISSPPDLICLCVNATSPPKLPCSDNNNNADSTTVQAAAKTTYTVHSGEKITIYMIAGDGTASVFGVVTARIRDIPPNVSVHLSQQDISSSIGNGGKCSKITYRIYHDHNATDNVNVTLELAPQEKLSHTFITLELKACPPGLQIKEDTCQCLDVFEIFELNCTVDGIIERPEDSWIGYTSEHQYGYSWSCPDGLCNDLLASVTIVPNLTTKSPMCNGGRTGTLCASCPRGKSIIFGSVECKECSNWFILTILFFCLCGIVLVLFLFVLQLTVKVGTINGVIFYANLLASGFTSGYLVEIDRNLYLLKLYVSFLNLNLGFPLCFYDGMTEVAYLLLNYVFPVYVWVIIGLIIYISKHSTRLSNWTGTHSVAVLATLLQLSYSNIMSNVAHSFPYTTIMTNNGSYTVWFAAGNIRYGSPIHIVHMVISLLFFLLFILPYTVLLTIAPFIGRYRIVSRYMPYLDVVYAPYKEKWRFWFGVRLCLLVVLLVIQAFLSGYSFKINLGAQVVSVMVFTLFQIHYKPFKNLLIHALDVFFMLSFCLSGFLAISMKSGKTLSVVIILLITTSFIVFLGILIYHFYMVFLKKRFTSQTWCLSKLSRSDSDESVSLNKSASYRSDSSKTVVLSQAPTKTVFNKLREPILDYIEYDRSVTVNHTY